MREANKSTMLDIAREHNSLNGFRLVVFEFVVVALAALLISSSGWLHGRALTALAGIGIFINASAVIAIAIRQIRAHDKNDGLMKIRSPEFRAKLRREHPDLSAHSVIVMVSVLVPFLLVILLSLQWKRSSGGKQM